MPLAAATISSLCSQSALLHLRFDRISNLLSEGPAGSSPTAQSNKSSSPGTAGDLGRTGGGGGSGSGGGSGGKGGGSGGGGDEAADAGGRGRMQPVTIAFALFVLGTPFHCVPVGCPP